MAGPPSPAQDPKIPQQQPATLAGIGGMAQEAQAMNQAAKVASSEALTNGEKLHKAAHSEAADAAYSAYLASLTRPGCTNASANAGNGALDKAATADATAKETKEAAAATTHGNNGDVFRTLFNTFVATYRVGATKAAAMPVPKPADARRPVPVHGADEHGHVCALIDPTIQPNPQAVSTISSLFNSASTPDPGAADMKFQGMIQTNDRAWEATSI